MSDINQLILEDIDKYSRTTPFDKFRSGSWMYSSNKEKVKSLPSNPSKDDIKRLAKSHLNDMARVERINRETYNFSNSNLYRKGHLRGTGLSYV